jgi:hypothetical protein
MFYLFRTYVAAGAFMLQVFHEQAWQRGAGEGGPLACAREVKQARSTRRSGARSCIHKRLEDIIIENERATGAGAWALVTPI